MGLGGGGGGGGGGAGGGGGGGGVMTLLNAGGDLQWSGRVPPMPLAAARGHGQAALVCVPTLLVVLTRSGRPWASVRVTLAAAPGPALSKLR